MVFDPVYGMSLEQILEVVWKQETPATQARIHALADRLGWTRNEVMLECRRRLLKDLEDPAKRLAWYEKRSRELQPYGKDPMLEGSAP